LRYLLFFLTVLFSQNLFAKNSLTSQFGFTSTLPDGWFLLTPESVEKTFSGETQKSLGIPEHVDKSTMSGIFEKIKGGNIEFYYDKNYLHNQYQNHVSAQLGEPIVFTSMDEIKKECDEIPAQLKKLYGEPVNLLACTAVPSNNRLVFSIAYDLDSMNLTIIHEKVQVNNKYSIEFVGGSANDMAGLKRVRAAQQILVDSVTKFLQEQQAK